MTAMSATVLLAQSAAAPGITDAGLRALGAFIAGGLAIAGGAIGAANGNAKLGAATITGIARQPEARGRLYGTMFLVVGLVEAAYFINLAMMLVFVYVLAR